MVYLVYHFDMNKYSCCLDSWSETKDGKRICSNGPSFPEEYEPVAAVEADSIDEVFEKTNHITQNWENNKGVIALHTFGKQHRSTSVGDVVVDDSNKPLICASCGWKEI